MCLGSELGRPAIRPGECQGEIADGQMVGTAVLPVAQPGTRHHRIDVQAIGFIQAIADPFVELKLVGVWQQADPDRS